jgi:hypothetical protein
MVLVMSYISKRFVKGKKYYYLEESFTFKNKLVKESVYFGSMYPSNDELFLGLEVLKRTCLERNHIVTNPPLTEFIKNRTSKIIYNLNKNFKTRINDSKKISYNKINSNKINLLKKCFENDFKLNYSSLNKCMNYYSRILKNNDCLTESKLKRMYCLLNGVKSKTFLVEEINLLHLLFVWLKEKDDLIHPIEFAVKFSSKLFHLNIFNEQRILFNLIVINYFLEKKGLPFVTLSKKRFFYFKNSLENNSNTNLKEITKFFTKELIIKFKSV